MTVRETVPEKVREAMRWLALICLVPLLPVLPAAPMLIAPVLATRLLPGATLTFHWSVIKVLLMCAGYTLAGFLLMGPATTMLLTLVPGRRRGPAVTTAVRYLAYIAVLTGCYHYVVRPLTAQLLAAVLAVIVMEVGDALWPKRRTSSQP